MTEDVNNGRDGRKNGRILLKEVGRPVYLEVDLDALSSNVNILRSKCKSHTGMISVVKAGAYGHGSVFISRHLKSIGVERLAVATVDEGLHLRKHGIRGPIHIFGNLLEWEMLDCVQFNLTPTICTVEAVEGMYRAIQECASEPTDPKRLCLDDSSRLPLGAINIKVDTGMSRNGCQPGDLPIIVKKCDEYKLPIDAMMTHFADSAENEIFTKKQLQTFLNAVQPYRSRGIKLHVANSGAVLNDIGTDLDFIRPGIALYGLPPAGNLEEFRSFGFKPLASVQGVPTLCKQLEKGREVGYSCTYTTADKEWVATIPDGYADGYWRHLSSLGVVTRNKTGAKCPVIGRVSMDAITIQVPEELDPYETFTLMSADYDPKTSATGIAEQVGTLSYEVATRLSVRYPRVYLHGQSRKVVPALSTESY